MITDQTKKTDTQVSQQALEAVRIAKEKAEASVLMRKAQLEEGKISRRNARRAFGQRIKHGIEKTIAWYEQEFVNLAYDGVVYGSAIALFSSALAMLLATPAFMSMGIVVGGITAIIPIAIALVYWAVKGLIELGRATVRGFKRVALNRPAIKQSMNPGNKPAQQNPPPPAATGAEATA